MTKEKESKDKKDASPRKRYKKPTIRKVTLDTSLHTDAVMPLPPTPD